jgi:hypothetical protein
VPAGNGISIEYQRNIGEKSVIFFATGLLLAQVAEPDRPSPNQQVSLLVNRVRQLLGHRGSSQGAQNEGIAGLWRVLRNAARGREGRQVADAINQKGHQDR